MRAAKDVSKLLAEVPKGPWVALSRDEERVIAYAAELFQALEKERERGENDPVVLRVPKDTSTLFLQVSMAAVPTK